MMGSAIHPVIVAAAHGVLPDWSRVRSSRMPHLASVASLLSLWAEQLGVKEHDRSRWIAAGWLHDALRDAEPESLATGITAFPRPVRHGPAAAERLRADGVDDSELLEAIAYHSLGKPGLGRLGRYLYLADYLEPNRSFAPIESAVLRARLPHRPEPVLERVCALRIADVLNRGRPLRPETVGFWNELLGSV